jgi:hypothetical protein
MQALTVRAVNTINRVTLALALSVAAAARADDSFTKGLSPSDFAAAGLGKLTPDELAKLDSLVRGQQTGAVKRATEETTKAVAAAVRQEVQAEDRKAAQSQPAAPGLVDRMKVLLKPGTQIEYTTLDATLLPPFNGWQRGTVFTLSNGQRWVASDNDEYWAPRTDKPLHVRIVPGMLGSFFMEIENGGRPRVKFLGSSPVPQAAQPAPAH